MKNFLLILAFLTGLFSTSMAWADAEVNLVSAMSRVYSYRGLGGQEARFVIKVDNLAPNKTVNLYYQAHDGQWRDLLANYLGVAGDGREVWQASMTLCTVVDSWRCDEITATDLNFAVRVEANDKIFWDNNQQQNFHLGMNDGYMLAPNYQVLINDKGEIRCDTQMDRCDLSGGRILLQNWAPLKTVTLVYSLDDWQTSAQVSAEFIDTTGSHPLSRFTNPGVQGGELWSFSILGLPANADDLEYFVKYDFGGPVAVDNNYAQNYRLGIPDFPAVYLRGTHNDWNVENGYQSMQKFTNYAGDSYWQNTIEFSGHSPSERFKFDIDPVDNPWLWNYGDSDNDGRNWQGIAEPDGGDIKILGGPGYYRVSFYDDSHAYQVEKLSFGPFPAARTLVFIQADNPDDEPTFLRGGIDWGYSQAVRGVDCGASEAAKWDCAIPMRHRLGLDDPTRSNDWYLDWHGAEDQQGEVIGSPMIWTTNDADFGKTVIDDGYGYTPLNLWGDNYWLLDAEIYCSGVGVVDELGQHWFELKSYNGDGLGWEGDIQQANTPYVSNNHFAQCGKTNVFKRNQNEALIYQLYP
ncbi:MAG: hypothetical protein ACI9PX_000670 [Reinekea sp.]|jgi:hypothetical protein